MAEYVVVVRSDCHPPVVAVTGEFDLCTVPDFERACAELVEAGTPALVVDLDGVTFADCAAVGALVRAAATARGAGVAMSFRYDRSAAVLRLCGLTEVTLPRA